MAPETKWTQEQLNRLRQIYPIIEDWKQLLDEFPFSTKRSIQAYASLLGLCKPRCSNAIYTLEHNLFSTWNEKSAYLLGYLEADGYFFEDVRALRVTFRTSIKDKNFVDDLKKIVGFNGKTTINKHFIKNKVYKTIGFVVSSRQWKIDLLGKYRTGQIPNIPDKLIHHYIRGYFDGDGTIYFDKKYKRVGFIFNNKILADNFLQILLSKVGFTNHIHLYSRNIINCWDIKIASQKIISKFQQFLYKDATIFLNRKKDIFNQ